MGKLVKKKLEKGKLIEQIADELEEDINVIQKTAEELMKRNEKNLPKSSKNFRRSTICTRQVLFSMLIRSIASDQYRRNLLMNRLF